MIKISVLVKPGSFKDEILVDIEDNITIKIKEKPIEGAANKYLINYLSKVLKVSKSQVILEKGTSIQHKRITLNIGETEFKQFINKCKNEIFTM